MTEEEAMEAARKKIKVALRAGGRTYLGRLTARYGSTSSFLFRGKRIDKRGETITYFGHHSDFLPARR